MKIKITIHIMPWEIDHAQIIFDRIRNSLTYTNKDDVIYVHACLNLSDSVIDWEKSTLPKNYFIDRYKAMEYYFRDLCNTQFDIFSKNEVWGHLDFQRNVHQQNIDYYISICPDIIFNEYLIWHMIETAKQVSNKYFVITPQIYKSWDKTWDVIVNDKFKNVVYDDCLSKNSNEITSLTEDIFIEELANTFKFSGWMDLYNKAFYEKLVPVLPEWHGYGSWDLYAMNICCNAVNIGVDVRQYIIKNQVIWFYDTGELRNEIEYGGAGKLKTVYQKYICKKLNRSIQRVPFDTNLVDYCKKWIYYYLTELKDK
jgi:hypothetical protein